MTNLNFIVEKSIYFALFILFDFISGISGSIFDINLLFSVKYEDSFFLVKIGLDVFKQL